MVLMIKKWYIDLNKKKRILVATRGGVANTNQGVNGVQKTPVQLYLQKLSITSTGRLSVEITQG
jgi:hypothetical protein